MVSPQLETRPASAVRDPARAVGPATAPGSAFWLAVGTLLWRELVRFYRQRSRVVGALGTPLLFWLLIGAGFGGSIRVAGPGPVASHAAGISYLAYLFPGTILMIVLFTAIFSTISVIEDRHEGFLLSVLVAPIPRTALVIGKVLGGAVLALAQGLLFVILSPLVGLRLGVAQVAQVIGVLFLVSFALAALGFYFAWRLDSVQGFHSVMNLLLLPMWLLSGAVFPVSGAHSWIGWVMRLNPLTYGMAALRRVLGSSPPGEGPSLAVCLAVMIAFSAVCAAADLWEVRKPA